MANLSRERTCAPVQVNYNRTKYACYIAFIVQAIINNLSPILFILYQKEFGISYSVISLLVVVNFLTQLLVDLFSVQITSRLGYRRSILLSQILAAAGLFLLGVLPRVMPIPFLGLAIPTVIYALGSGLIEVLDNPIIENLPLENKASQLQLLHSFYCWGQMGVVLISTLLLRLIGQSNWIFLPMLWALVPLVNAFLFARAPIIEPPAEGSHSFGKLLKSRVYLCGLVLIFCAGAAELSMSQWSSLFVEKSLGIPKTVGDLLGPCLFAVFMGLGRLLYGLFGHKLDLRKGLAVCAVLNIAAYLLTALSPIPALSMVGCTLCGLSVSLMWPGTLSITAEKMHDSGTAMFAGLAVMGDMGCIIGPFVAGVVSDAVDRTGVLPMNGLNAGLLMGSVVGVLMLIALRGMKKAEK